MLMLLLMLCLLLLLHRQLIHLVGGVNLSPSRRNIRGGGLLLLPLRRLSPLMTWRLPRCLLLHMMTLRLLLVHRLQQVMLMLRCSAWRDGRRDGRCDERCDERRDERCDGLRDGTCGCLELLLHRQLIPLLGRAILSPSRRHIRDGGLLLLPLHKLSPLMTWRLLPRWLLLWLVRTLMLWLVRTTLTCRGLLSLPARFHCGRLLVRMVKRLPQLRRPAIWIVRQWCKPICKCYYGCGIVDLHCTGAASNKGELRL